MGSHRFCSISFPFAHIERTGKTRNPGTDMDHGSSGKIKGPEIMKPSASRSGDGPDPVGQRIVDKGGPEKGKDDKRGKLHPFGKGAGNQRRRNHREHHLENHEGLMRYRRRRIGVWIVPNTTQTKPGKAPDDPPFIRSKGEGISPEDPLYGNQAEDDKALHDGAENVLFPPHPAVEEGKTRRGH